MFTSQKLLDLLCPHLSPAWYQELLCSASVPPPTFLAGFFSLLEPAGRVWLGFSCFSGKLGRTGFPVNLVNVLKGEQELLRSTDMRGAGVMGLGTPS